MLSTRQILVDVSSPDLTNLGDAAMLVVAVRRLRALAPGASIHVLTNAPERVAALCAGIEVETLSEDARRIWLAEAFLVGRARRMVPSPLVGALHGVQQHIRARHADRALTRVTNKIRRQHGDDYGLRQFVSVLQRVDLAIATGGGYINDTFRPHAMRVLKLLSLARQFGATTALVGQGLGPATDARLVPQFRRTLRSVAAVALRERLVGPALLDSIGVRRDRVHVSGDDAIELAFESRTAVLGDAIGVNLRLARYAGLQDGAAAEIARGVHAAAHRLHGELRTVPIMYRPHDAEADDITAARDLFGASWSGWPDPSHPRPEDVIQLVGGCRVVVTGSYHAAVFALSQGIPAVCLAANPYYDHKFSGLADMFGAGCTVVGIDGDVAARIDAAIGAAWDSAEQLRDRLLASARRQVAAGHAAYGAIRDRMQVATTTGRSVRRPDARDPIAAVRH